MSLTLDRLGEGVENRPAPEAGGSRRFRPDIQGLRAVAVTLVVLYHGGVGVLHGGYVGVDVFFVISGFLISGHLLGELERSGRISLTSFYARRARRLLPPALLVIVTTVVLARLVGPVLQAPRTTQDGFFTLFYAMNYRLAGEGVDYQLANAAPSPLQHFWSLAVEEQFYVVWPVLLIVVGWLARRLRPGARRGVVLALIGTIVAVSFVVSLGLTSANPPLAYYSLQSRAWELGVGATIAVLLPALSRLPRVVAATATWLGLGMVLAAAVLLTDRTPFPGTAALLPVLGAGLVLVGGAAAPAYGVERVLRGRLTQLVGNVSYGWYLWHWPALILGPAIYGHPLDLVDKLTVCVLAFWLAVMSYLVLERPAPRLRVPLRRWLAIGLSLSLLAAAVIGAVYVARPDIQGSGATVSAVNLNPVGMSTLRTAQKVSLRAPVPANLTPGLDDAADDVPPTSHDGCHVTFLKVAEAKDCVFGDRSAKRTLLLFGDSHAEQWFGALQTFAKAEHYRLVSWTKVACPLADTVLRNEQLGRAYTECGRWRAERLRAIEKLAPDVIVASQADTLPGPSYSNELWATQTAKTLRTLAASTSDLVYLGDTPRPPVDTPTCLSEHLADAGACAVPSDAALGADDDFRYLVQRHAALAQAVQTVDVTRVNPQDWFCTGARCPAVVANTLVFRDASHMTQTYSRTIEPLLRPVITRSTRSGDSHDPS